MHKHAPCSWDKKDQSRLILCLHLSSTPFALLRTHTVTNAARTMLMNLETCQWHEPYLPLFDIPALFCCAHTQ